MSSYHSIFSSFTHAMMRGSFIHITCQLWQMLEDVKLFCTTVCTSMATDFIPPCSSSLCFQFQASALLTISRQDAFMENYLSQQRQHVFSSVGVLIYVFDIESRDFDRDLLTYRSIITALTQFSPTASIYVLIHKMDLVLPNQREDSFHQKISLVRSKSESFNIVPFATSIWDQSLYKAWAEIIHDLVPNLGEIERHLSSLGTIIEAEEVLLFERSSFLVVSSWTSPEGEANPTTDRFERLSNIIKNFKQSTSRYTGTPKSAEQFSLLELKMPNFSMFVVKFTTNTYLAAILPPGEERFNCALENAKIAARDFEELDSPARKSADRGATNTEAGIV